MARRSWQRSTKLVTSALGVAVLAVGCGRFGYSVSPGAQADAGLDAPVSMDAGPRDAYATPSLDARRDDAFAPAPDASTADAYAPDAAPECVDAADCDDGDACTVDACTMGACMRTARDCDDGFACTMDVCSSAVGCMHPPDPGAPCAAGRRCDPTGTGRDGSAPDPAGCVLAAECMVDLDCDDGAFCTLDTCVLSVCESAAVRCFDDGSACTRAAFCDESADACADPFDATSLTDPSHCGTSAATCVAPCPSGLPNTEATCIGGACGSRCLPGFHDLDRSLANGCEYACTITAMGSDPPDGVDANCDGADGVVGATLYVRTDGMPTGAGLSPDAAVSLERGLALAAMAGLPRLVLVAAGVYPRSTALAAPPGLVLFGGYATDFRSRGMARSRVQSFAARALMVDGGAAELDGLDLSTADQVVPGQSTQTLVVRGSPGVVLRDVRLTAGRGGRGTDGARGSDGTNGAPGAPSVGQEPGGVWREVGAGGRAPTTFMGPVGEGSAGASIGACTAPGGGYSFHIGTGSCVCSPTTVNYGEAGGNGCAGADGAAGAGGSSGGGTIDAMGDWAPPAGATGTDGATGEAGGIGGGGGAGGVQVCNNITSPGTGGGQGGGGGSPGAGGRAGGPGGGSFAIVAVSSTLTLTSVALATAGGGAGGEGGDGGPGGPGGPGGTGDSPITLDAMCVPMRTSTGGVGGTGGTGGTGGRGGCGGGGAGGPSVGIISGAGVTIAPGATIVSMIAPGGAGGAACAAGGGAAGAAGVRAEML